jgi:hypothetical protein
MTCGFLADTGLRAGSCPSYVRVLTGPGSRNHGQARTASVQACYQNVHLIADLGVACQRGHPSREDPARSPSTNAYAERFVLTARSQVTHRILIFGERHLRSVLTGYAWRYNGQRPIAVKLHGFECEIPQITCRAIYTRPARPSLRRPLAGADQAPTRTWRPHQPIRAGCVKALVKDGGRVLAPHRLCPAPSLAYW